MAAIKPFINSYEAGELAPDMAGMLDREIYLQGAKEITNFVPGRGACKRNSMQNVMSYIDTDEPIRGINWAIGEHSFNILFFDGFIKILDITDEDNPAYLQEEGSDIEIYFLDGPAEIYPAYAAEDIAQIQYAKSNNDIVMVCKGMYPAFFMRLSEITVTNEVIIEYGTVQYTGNIAKSPDPSDVDADATAMKAEDLLYAVRNLTLDTLYTATGYIDIGGTQYTITGITVSGSVTPRYANYWSGLPNGTPTQVVQDSAVQTFPGSTLTCYGTRIKWSWFVRYWADSFFSTLAAMTKTQFLDKCQEYLTNGGLYVLDANSKVGDGIFGYVRYYNEVDNRTLTIHLTGHADLVITVASPDTIGIINITSLGKTIESGTVDGREILDKTIPWMEPDKPYPCSPLYTINGVAPETAVRVDNGGESSLHLFFGDETMKLEITKESPGINGRVGIILTPFYNTSEHPQAVWYHQSRLVLAYKNSIFISKSNDHSNFTYFDELQYEAAVLAPKPWTDPNTPEYRQEIYTTQQVSPDSAIRYTFATEEDESIKWISASRTDLIIGTATSEWAIPGVLDATKIPVASVSRRGSKYIQSRVISQFITYVSASGRKLWAFDSQAGDMSPDLMEFADHIARSGIKAIDFRQDPRDEIILTMEDGTIIVGHLHGRGVAWYRFRTTTGDSVRWAWVAAGETEDVIYCIVERHSGLIQYSTLERIATRYPEEFAGLGYLDSCIIQENLAAVPATGFVHLYGAANVAILVKRGSEHTWGVPSISNLGVISQYTPDGETTPVLLEAGDSIMVGLRFTARLETFRIDSPDTEGLYKSGGPIEIRVYNTGPFKIGSPRGDLQDARIPNYNGNTYPYSGIISAIIDAPSDQDQSVVVESDTPLRVQVLSMVPTLDVGG